MFTQRKRLFPSLNGDSNCIYFEDDVGLHFSAPGGGDWLLVRPDGVGEIDARETWQAEDGALLYVTKRDYITNVPGLTARFLAGEPIPHEEYYFVVTQYVETSAAQYAWLQQVVAIGMGSLIQGGIGYQVFVVS
jgi:hypothetical protein